MVYAGQLTLVIIATLLFIGAVFMFLKHVWLDGRKSKDGQSEVVVPVVLQKNLKHGIYGNVRVFFGKILKDGVWELNGESDINPNVVLEVNPDDIHIVDPVKALLGMGEFIHTPTYQHPGIPNKMVIEQQKLTHMAERQRDIAKASVYRKEHNQHLEMRRRIEELRMLSPSSIRAAAKDEEEK